MYELLFPTHTERLNSLCIAPCIRSRQTALTRIRNTTSCPAEELPKQKALIQWYNRVRTLNVKASITGYMLAHNSISISPFSIYPFSQGRAELNLFSKQWPRSWMLHGGASQKYRRLIEVSIMKHFPARAPLSFCQKADRLGSADRTTALVTCSKPWKSSVIIN